MALRPIALLIAQDRWYILVSGFPKKHDTITINSPLLYALKRQSIVTTKLNFKLELIMSTKFEQGMNHTDI
jgi:hypothetical protein